MHDKRQIKLKFLPLLLAYIVLHTLLGCLKEANKDRLTNPKNSMNQSSITSSKAKYSRAPIVEAYVDFRVNRPSSVPENLFAEKHEEIKALFADIFPECHNIMFDALAKARPVKASGEHGGKNAGFMFVSSEHPYILYAGYDIFVINTIPPYVGWEKMLSLVSQVWDIYRSIGEITSFRRVAVKYVNKINIPMTTNGVNPSDYFKTLPLVSTKYSYRDVISFSLKLLIPQDDLDCRALITQRRVKSPSDEVLSVLLGIDIYKDNATDIQDDDGLWELLRQIRERKNQIFEGTITDATRELIA